MSYQISFKFHFQDRPEFPDEYEKGIQSVQAGGTTILSYLPSEGGRRHCHHSLAAGSVAEIPHDMREHHRAPSRGKPSIIADDTGVRLAYRVPVLPLEQVFPGPEQTQLAYAFREQRRRLNKAECA